MRVGDYEIPENWESMSCMYNCGYILVWERKVNGGSDAGSEMERHIIIHHTYPLPSLWDWFRGFRRRGKK